MSHSVSPFPPPHPTPEAGTGFWGPYHVPGAAPGMPRGFSSSAAVIWGTPCPQSVPCGVMGAGAAPQLPAPAWDQPQKLLQRPTPSWNPPSAHAPFGLFQQEPGLILHAGKLRHREVRNQLLPFPASLLPFLQHPRVPQHGQGHGKAGNCTWK